MVLAVAESFEERFKNSVMLIHLKHNQQRVPVECRMLFVEYVLLSEHQCIFIPI